jgi:hypothetical protein
MRKIKIYTTNVKIQYQIIFILKNSNKEKKTLLITKSIF